MADRSPPRPLRADCAQCAGLCCVGPGFSKSADFAVDKPPGVPCLHLADDSSCSIHERLLRRGFAGCTTYDCFGAGQQVVQHTYAGTDWRQAPALADEMFRVFAAMRRLHELLWYLTEALDLDRAGPVRRELAAARARTEDLTRLPAGELDGFDLDAHRDAVVPLLRRASELTRADTAGTHADLAGADLVGRDLRVVDLRGASLRGAVLVGADLRLADLRLADVTGADLRATDVRGTDLGAVLFLTQVQVNAAVGDADTSLPAGLDPPTHWVLTGPSRGHRLHR